LNLPVIFSPRAQDDLGELEEYLAERFSERNAQKYIQRIITACESLAIAPYRGTKHDDIRPGVRSTGFERRVTIYFDVRDDAIAILYVLYAGRLRR
jgi:toxin ParE1/3/4